MATGFHKIHNGLNIYPSSNAPTVQGDIAIDSSSGDILYHNGTTADHVQTASNTATLTNKSIDATTNTLSNISNASISSSAAIAYSKLNLTSSIVNSDISSSAAIAYSKLNLASSILNSDISASAAIARSKIATGTASQVLVNDVSGNMSSVASISIAQGGTGQATQQAAINALTGTQSSGKYLRSDGTNATLSNIQAGDVPTLNQNTTGTAANVTGTVAIANGGTGQNTANAAFNALSPNTTKGDFTVYSGAANVRQGVGTDGQVLVADSSQTNGLKWATLNQGAKNYITYNNFENNATTGWSLAHSALSGTTPTSVASAGTAFDSTHGGSAASGNLSFIAASTTPLAGQYSGKLASTAATTVGDMLITQAYSIDVEDQAKVLTGKFYYQAFTGASNFNFSGTSSNSYAIWIYDVMNAAWIMPAGVYGMTQGTGTGYVTFTFQTPSNMTQFQVAIIAINATAGLVSLYVDDVYVGPQTAPIGAVMTDWVAYTPTFTGFGTPTNVSFYSRRVGPDLEVNGVFQCGTNTGVNNQITLGFNGVNNNVTISSAAFPSTSSGAITVGTAAVGQTQAVAFSLLASSGGNYVGIGAQSPSFSSNAYVLGTEFSNTAYITIRATVPITGWSSNVQMSSDTDTRVVALLAQSSNANLNYNGGSPNSTVPSTPGQVVFNTTVNDTHGAYNSTTGVYTIPVSGYYNITGSLYAAGTGVNSGYMNTLIYNVTTSSTITNNQIPWLANFPNPVSAVTINAVYLTAGTQICIKGASTVTSPTYQTGNVVNFFSVNRCSGPATIAASESVNARYSLTTTTGSFSTETKITGFTKQKDTHLAWDSTNNKYVAVVPGFFHFDWQILFTVGGTAATVLPAYKVNGGSTKYLGTGVSNVASGASRNGGSFGEQLNAGDYIEFYVFTNNSITLTNGDSNTFFSVFRTGN